MNRYFDEHIRSVLMKRGHFERVCFQKKRVHQVNANAYDPPSENLPQYPDDNAHFLGSISASSQTWDHRRKQTRSSASVRSKSKHSRNHLLKHDTTKTLRQHRDKFLTNVIRIKQSIPCM